MIPALRLWTSLLVATACTASAAEPPRVEVRCKNGSRFKGSLLEIGTDRARIEAEFLTEPVPLKLDHILEIVMPADRGELKGDHVATVQLSNGDTLCGELTGVTETEISLRTWYAGELKLRRTMVDTLDIQDRPDIIYAGPNGLDGWWQEKRDGWLYEDGVLRNKTSGAIARKLELPTKVRFAFDASWRSNPRFMFKFFSDNADAKEPSNCYALSVVSGRYVELKKRVFGNATVSVGAPQQIPEFMNREKVRVELLADRKSGLIQMLVNGRIAADWTDPEPAVGRMGGGIHFDCLDSSPPLRFSRIEVTSWDGVVEGRAEQADEGFLGDDEDGEPDKKKDLPEPDPKRIRLRNNDHVEGEMLGIENGKVKLKTKFGDMNLPVSRLRTFPLRSKKERDDYKLGRYEVPKRYNGDIRAWFADGSHVTFRLEGAGDGQLKGSSQTFGKADFDSKAFGRIEFNLYDPDLEDQRHQEED